MSVDDAVSFAHLVRERRQALDLTQAQLAEQVGCSVELVRKIERGERRPSRETAARLLRFLGLEDATLPTPFPAPLPQSHPIPPPAPAITLVGREAELSSLTRLLANPQCRLITLTGPGGVGKTHLALTAARQAHFPDATGYTALENINTPERLPLALAAAAGLSLAGSGEPVRQLAMHLRRHRLLLLLDNFEHLVRGAALLAELLQEAPGLRLLVTSRERLGLPGEWLVDLHGLSLTPAGGAAFTLFARQAERARGTPLTPAEYADAVRICRLLDGVPLAIELAAGWARSLSCAEIADELTRSLDFLDSGAHDLPPRQRSIRAIFDSSWALLDEQQRTHLRRLAVFAGGFDRRAASEVTGVGPLALAALIDRSLLRREANGRYTIQPLLHEFAARQLAAAPDAEELCARHARYFAGLLGETLSKLLP